MMSRNVLWILSAEYVAALLLLAAIGYRLFPVGGHLGG